jgi:hypothetical protein
MLELSREQIDYLRENNHIKDILSSDGEISRKSQIIQNHFGIVP